MEPASSRCPTATASFSSKEVYNGRLDMEKDAGHISHGCACEKSCEKADHPRKATMTRLLLTLALSALLATVFVAGSPEASLQVRTTSGTFQGVSAGSPNNTEKWLGVPFAQAPVGSLRFKAPVAITKPSHSVKVASQFGNACPQEPSDSLGAPMAEDCLFLNVGDLLVYVFVA